MRKTFLSTVAVAAIATGFTGYAADPAAPAATPSPEAWKTTAGANLALAKGNSDTMLVGGNILAEKKWDKNELRLKADASYGDSKIKGERSTTAQTYGVGMQYNRLINERLYGYLNADARQDRIADIDYRITLSPGLGYYIIKNEKTMLAGEVGPGVVFERVGNDDRKYFTIRFAERFTHKFNDRTTLFQSLEYLPQVDDWNNYVIVGDIGVEAKMTEKLGLRVTFSDNYRSQPAPGLKHNDLRLLAGVTYTF